MKAVAEYIELALFFSVPAFIIAVMIISVNH